MWCKWSNDAKDASNRKTEKMELNWKQIYGMRNITQILGRKWWKDRENHCQKIVQTKKSIDYAKVE